MKDLRGYLEQERRAVLFGGIWFAVGLTLLLLAAHEALERAGR